VVSGRDPAALDLLALLAPRRQADLARRRPDRREGEEDRRDAEAEALLGAIAEELGVEPDYVAPAYEDPAEWIIKEATCRTTSRRRTPSWRTRGAPPHRPGVRARPDDAVGLCAADPALAGQGAGDALASEKWKTRRGKLFLCPATARSATGCRWARCPCAAVAISLCEHPPIPRNRAAPARFRDAPADRAPNRAGRQPIARSPRAAACSRCIEQELGELGGAVRTALSVEPRDGRLCVFMPPVERLEDYLELVAAAEKRAAELGLPVHIEGYAPPTTRA
jgi:uncharacterized protein (DUF2126 family)